MPNTAHKLESRNPKPKTAGPSMPSVILFAARLMENHNTAICVYPKDRRSWRSSGSTRWMPRASRLYATSCFSNLFHCTLIFPAKVVGFVAVLSFEGRPSSFGARTMREVFSACEAERGTSDSIEVAIWNHQQQHSGWGDCMKSFRRLCPESSSDRIFSDHPRLAAHIPRI